MNIELDEEIINYIFILLPPMISAVIAIISSKMSTKNPKSIDIKQKQLEYVYLPLYREFKCEIIDNVSFGRIADFALNLGPKINFSKLPALDSNERIEMLKLIDVIIEQHYLLIPKELYILLRKFSAEEDDELHFLIVDFIISKYNYLKRYLGYPSCHGYQPIKYMDSEMREKAFMSFFSKAVFIFTLVAAVFIMANYEPSWNIFLIRILILVFAMFVMILIIASRMSMRVKSGSRPKMFFRFMDKFFLVNYE